VVVVCNVGDGYKASAIYYVMVMVMMAITFGDGDGDTIALTK